MTAAAKPSVLRWAERAGAIATPLGEAGLAERIELHTARMGEQPPPGLLERVDAMVAWRGPPTCPSSSPRPSSS
jgi:hypothetical protein